MATMTHRTTFSLDDQAISRLKTLSRRWNVSQAEVVRRALEAADHIPHESTALANLKAYHQTGGLDADSANSFLGEWSEARNDWGRE